MSRFGKSGVRCDGCGIFTANRDGYYVDPETGKGGTISNSGRNCDHDLCDVCEARTAPLSACPKCGVRPDGSAP